MVYGPKINLGFLHRPQAELTRLETGIVASDVLPAQRLKGIGL
jgi:hypothetical protein